MEKQRILAVDDEEHILELIEYNLMQKGFEVLKAGSGKEALSLLDEENVDLVLLGWNGWNGSFGTYSKEYENQTSSGNSSHCKKRGTG